MSALLLCFFFLTMEIHICLQRVLNLYIWINILSVGIFSCDTHSNYLIKLKLLDSSTLYLTFPANQYSTEIVYSRYLRVPTSTVPSTHQYCRALCARRWQETGGAGDAAMPCTTCSKLFLVLPHQNASNSPTTSFFLTQRMKNIFPLPRSTWIIQSCISLQRSRPNWPHAHICTQSATESVTFTTIKTMLNCLVLVFVVFSCF